jgi:hypothetical protein
VVPIPQRARRDGLTVNKRTHVVVYNPEESRRRKLAELLDAQELDCFAEALEPQGARDVNFWGGEDIE